VAAWSPRQDARATIQFEQPPASGSLIMYAGGDNKDMLVHECRRGALGTLRQIGFGGWERVHARQYAKYKR